MNENHFSVIVVGKGLMAVAAARYLAERMERIALIGPGEPADFAAHDGVFSSHYDSGRITRVLDPQLIWAQLALNSIKAYAKIEERSGIQFYYPSGCLTAGPAGDSRMSDTIAVGHALNRKFDVVSGTEMRQRYPALCFPLEFTGIDERHPAGHVDPRAFVAASLAVGQQDGLHYVDAIVSEVKPGKPATVQTRAGHCFTADTVVVAAGAYCNPMLPERLHFTMAPRTVVMARVSGAEAERVAAIPSLIGRQAPGSTELDGFYSVPVMRYPDGHLYFKIGGSMADLVDTTSFEEVNNWFRTGGSEREVAALREVLNNIIVDFQPDGYEAKPCVINHTASGFPYVDEIAEGIIITSGGHGSAAKSANEIGRLGALLALGEAWPAEFSRESFKAIFAA